MSLNYNPNHYESIKKIEDNHFWFRSRNKMIEKMIIKFISFNNFSKLSYFEVGVGTGIVASLFARFGFQVFGIDVNKKAVQIASKRCTGNFEIKSIFTYSSKRQFDVVGAFDVLEHIGDDERFLKIVNRLLCHKGKLLLTVPAHKWLWSYFDVFSGHKRRYEEANLIAKLKKAGFKIEFINYWQVFTFIPYVIFRKIYHQSNPNPKKSLQASSQIVNYFFYLLLMLEQQFIFILKFPIGASLVLCAIKIHEK